MSHNNIKDNIIIVYLKRDLKFEELAHIMKEYVKLEYANFQNDNIFQKKLFESVSNLKKLIEQVYSNGITIYSSIHGILEVDILANALEPYIIRTAHLSSTDDRIIIPLSDKDIQNIITEKDKDFIPRTLMKELEQYLKGYKGEEDEEI